MLKLTALNPFRILSLPANTEHKELKRVISATRKKLKVGLPLEISLAGFYPDVEAASAIDELEQALTDPLSRTAFRCLWSFDKGLVTDPEDFIKAAKVRLHGKFLHFWYLFEASKSTESLRSCLQSREWLIRSRVTLSRLVKIHRPQVTVNGVPTIYPATEMQYDANGNLIKIIDAQLMKK